MRGLALKQKFAGPPLRAEPSFVACSSWRGYAAEFSRKGRSWLTCTTRAGGEAGAHGRSAPEVSGRASKEAL